MPECLPPIMYHGSMYTQGIMVAMNGLSLSFYQLVESRSIFTVLDDKDGYQIGTPRFVNRLVPSTHILFLSDKIQNTHVTQAMQCL